MSTNEFLYLSRADVEQVNLDMRSMIGLLEEAFREKGNGRVEMPPKPGIHTQPDAFIHAMPAYIPAMRSAGIKWVSGYPGNASRGLPYISGLLILNDVETGIPEAVMDCTWITAQRTAAATALSAKFLARSDSERVGILACGVQGRSNLEALACTFKVSKVYAYDIVPEVQRRYVREMGEKLGLDIVGVKGPRQAVEDAELIVTSGPILKHPMPTIEKDWLGAGTFASAVDFDSYFSGAAMAQMDRVCTDDLAQFLFYKSGGYFQETPMPYAELGELVVGVKPGRQSTQERCMAINLGLGMDDMAVAPTVLRLAREKGLGRVLPL
jgi:ornithine cyclodeaminase/alanine dehydrogenase